MSATGSRDVQPMKPLELKVIIAEHGGCKFREMKGGEIVSVDTMQGLLASWSSHIQFPGAITVSACRPIVAAWSLGTIDTIHANAPVAEEALVAPSASLLPLTLPSQASTDLVAVPAPTPLPPPFAFQAQLHVCPARTPSLVLSLSEALGKVRLTFDQHQGASYDPLNL